MNNNETNIIQREDELLIPENNTNSCSCICKILAYIFGFLTFACLIFGLVLLYFFPDIGLNIVLYGSIGFYILLEITLCFIKG